MKTKAGKTLSSISKVRVLITIYRPNYGIKHIKNVNRAQRFVFYENKDYLCGRFKLYSTMKKIFTLVAMMAFAIVVSAQTKKVSILGDSYSTFQGMNPEGYAPFYPNDKNDVTKVEQTWWSLYIKAMGYELEKNNSWGGTTICNTGYGGMDATANSFNARYELLGNPDIIFVFGGTNDAWARSPIGEYKYADWTKDDCKAFRPALACLLVNLQKKYPKAKVYAILNSELREEINESSREVCKHYNVPLIELHDIEKQNGHPSISGMKSICEQLIKAIGK